MRLVLVRHAESTENATKNSGFYQNPRPWTGSAAHALSRDLVGLTPRGFRQCQWLRRVLPDFLDPDPHVFSSEYRRARDTAELALPGRPSDVTALLNEQHYADATYMTFEELFTLYPDTQDDRQHRKHLWTPPGEGGESLAGAVMARAGAFLADLDGVAAPDAVAVTHHTALLALRSLLERRPVTDVVEESRERKVPNGAVLVYERRGAVYHQVAVAEPDC